MIIKNQVMKSEKVQRKLSKNSNKSQHVWVSDKYNLAFVKSLKKQKQKIELFISYILKRKKYLFKLILNRLFVLWKS